MYICCRWIGYSQNPMAIEIRRAKESRKFLYLFTEQQMINYWGLLIAHGLYAEWVIYTCFPVPGHDGLIACKCLVTSGEILTKTCLYELRVNYTTVYNRSCLQDKCTYCFRLIKSISDFFKQRIASHINVPSVFMRWSLSM